MDPCKSVVEGLHCAKGVQLPSFFWSLFSRIWTEDKDLRSKSLYSRRIQEDTDQKKTLYLEIFPAMMHSDVNKFF